MLEFIYLLAGFVAGFIVSYFIGRVGRSQYNSLLEERKASYERQLAAQQEACREAVDREREAGREALARLRESFDETAANLQARVSEVTEEMLSRRQKDFESSSRATMESITAPLTQNLREMKEAVDRNSERHTALGTQLETNIKQMLEHSDAAFRSADRLANVLQGGGRQQGEMGEVILTELLEHLHLIPGVHFDIQPQLDRETKGVTDNESQRPDVIIHFDRSRHLVVDAKVSTTAFYRYMEATDDAERRAALQKHVESIETHVKGLVRRNYPLRTYHGEHPLDFVVMFVPFKAALREALRAKPSLWREAMERKVYIADEETMFALLKVVSLTWEMNSRAENHEELYRLADELMDRVNDFLAYFTTIKSGLDNATRAYDDAYGKLTEGRQSVAVTCRKFKDLGAKPSLKGKKKEHPLLQADITANEEKQED